MSEDIDLDALFADMDASITRVSIALRGTLKNEFQALRRLDPDTIKDITPDTTDTAMYERLMLEVQEASARNEDQAQLKNRIEALGGLAVKIAKVAGGIL